jgi:glycosyltransferase involved in cell wall biosynthesis
VKLACVVQRYGAGIAGGSEAHCLAVAERLAATHDVTVLTTCATDYVTWANRLRPGDSREGGVLVKRFRVARERRLKRFADISDRVFDGPTTADEQREWFAENGPDAPDLLEHLRRHGGDYDLVLFWTFRYAPSFFGLPLVADRAVLVPTAEEDAALDLDVVRDLLQLPAGYLFLTPEERDFVGARAERRLEPHQVIGIGLEPPVPAAERALATLDVPPRFLLYLGRVDRNKGCHTLFEYFQEYAADRPDATLVLAGPSTLRIPDHPRIRALGFVPDAVRHALLARAEAIVIPSPYESLSIVLLEAWNQSVPALVNAHCSVLRGQVGRAQGGLSYRTRREFAEAADVLRADSAVRSTLGSRGFEYVEREYRWPTVLERIETLLAETRARRTQR